MAIKRMLLANQALLRPGIWNIDGRVAFNAGATRRDLHLSMEKFVTSKGKNLGSIRNLTKLMVFAFLRLRNVRIPISEKSYDGTLVYLSRSKSPKIFDFTNKIILTKSSPAEWDNYQRTLERAMFRHFPTAGAECVEFGDQLFRKDEMIEATPVGLFPIEEILNIYRKMVKIYRVYIKDVGVKPCPDILMDSFYEVRNSVSDTSRIIFDQLEGEVIDFAGRCGFVEGHTDFNIANILYNGNLYLVDIADAGLQVPGLYDINNFALNELYEGRDLSLLRAIASDEDKIGINEAADHAIYMRKKDDVNLSLFVSFFMRHSNYVSIHLTNKSVNSTTINRRLSDLIEAMSGFDPIFWGRWSRSLGDQRTSTLIENFKERG